MGESAGVGGFRDFFFFFLKRRGDEGEKKKERERQTCEREVVVSGRLSAPPRLSELKVTGRSAPRRTQLHYFCYSEEGTFFTRNFLLVSRLNGG